MAGYRGRRLIGYTSILVHFILIIKIKKYIFFILVFTQPSLFLTYYLLPTTFYKKEEKSNTNRRRVGDARQSYKSVIKSKYRISLSMRQHQPYRN